MALPVIALRPVLWARDGSFGVGLWKSDLVADDPDDALLARLRAAQKKPVEKIPPPPREEDDDPWDEVLIQTGSPTLTILALPPAGDPMGPGQAEEAPRA